jgi:biotin carboxyl carrier protein
MKTVVTENRKPWKIESKDGQYFIDGEEVSVDVYESSPSTFHLLLDNQSYRIQVVESDDAQRNFSFTVNGRKVHSHVVEALEELIKEMGLSASAKKASDLKAPMPGLVLSIPVEVGQEFSEGDPLIVLEAMKMENVLKAPAAGKVKAVCVEVNGTVGKNEVLLEFE